MSAPSTTPPAGWYPDPEAPGRQRWWNGAAWAPSTPAQSAPRTNTLAILGLNAGILAVGSFMGPLGIVFGITGLALALYGIRQAQSTGAGLQLARWALAISIAGTALAAIWNLITR